MRRGCRVLLVHFHSYPILSRASQEKVRELAALLTRYQQRIAAVPGARSATSSSRSCSPCRPPLRVVIYRRLMLRIAEAHRARAARAGALVTGEVDRPGGVADAREPDDDRVGGDAAGLPAADRHGQGRDHRPRRSGSAPIRSRSSRIRTAASCSRRSIRRPGRGWRDVEAAERALPIDEIGATRPSRAPVVEDFRFPVIRSPVDSGAIVQMRRHATARGRPWQFRLSVRTIEEILGRRRGACLQHQCKTIPKETPAPARARFRRSHLRRCPIGRRACSAACSRCSNTAGSAGTGYVSILPVDQGIEHSAGASFAPNPMYFDPENIVKLAIEGGCNAVASTLGVLGLGGAQVRAQDSVHPEVQPQRVPLVSERVRSDSVRAASSRRSTWARMGVGATIYFGSEESKRQIQEVTEMFQQAHELGHVHRALVLPAEPGVQDEGSRLPPRRRPHRPGQPPRRDDRGRHHQAEAAGEQRRLQRAQLRQDAQEGLLAS